MAMLMIKQGDEKKLVGAIITDDGLDEQAAHSDCLKRLFQPVADTFSSYTVEIYPPVPGFPLSLKNRLLTDPDTLDSLQEIIQAHKSGRN
jgi:hypothetical protein